MIYGNDTAMPKYTRNLDEGYSTGGLNIREHLAALAMQGFCASGAKFSEIAQTSVAMADALIAELNKPV